MSLPFFGWEATASIDLKEHIFVYGTMHQSLYME